MLLHEFTGAYSLLKSSARVHCTLGLVTLQWLQVCSSGYVARTCQLITSFKGKCKSDHAVTYYIISFGRWKLVYFATGKETQPTNLTRAVPAPSKSCCQHRSTPDLREVEHGLSHMRDVHFLQVLEGLHCREGAVSRWIREPGAQHPGQGLHHWIQLGSLCGGRRKNKERKFRDLCSAACCELLTAGWRWTRNTSETVQRSSNAFL